MLKLTHTNRTLTEVGVMLRKGLQDELIEQKHNATHKLSRGLKYHIKGSILNIISSVAYWKAVNNPKFAKVPNLKTILRWMSQRGIEGGVSAAKKILGRLSNGKKEGQSANYGNKTYPSNDMRQRYVVYTEGNKVRRTNFAGYTANKFSKQVADKLAPSVGVDVANMIADKIRRNTKANVIEAF